MLKFHKNLLEVYAEEVANNDIRITEIPVSMVLAQPGDIISFDYFDEERRYSHRLCLVVSTSFAPNGRRISSRGNRLVCIYDLTQMMDFELKLVIDVCYKRRRRCIYNKTPRALNEVIGSHLFKTFIIPKMFNLKKLNIGKVGIVGNIINKFKGK